MLGSKKLHVRLAGRCTSVIRALVVDNIVERVVRSGYIRLGRAWHQGSKFTMGENWSEFRMMARGGTCLWVGRRGEIRPHPAGP